MPDLDHRLSATPEVSSSTIPPASACGQGALEASGNSGTLLLTSEACDYHFLLGIFFPFNLQGPSSHSSLPVVLPTTTTNSVKEVVSKEIPFVVVFKRFLF